MPEKIQYHKIQRELAVVETFMFIILVLIIVLFGIVYYLSL